MHIFPSGECFNAILYFCNTLHCFEMLYIWQWSCTLRDRLLYATPLRTQSAASQFFTLEPDITFSQNLLLLSKSCFTAEVSLMLALFLCLIQRMHFFGSVFKTALSNCWLVCLVTAVDGQQGSLKKENEYINFCRLGRVTFGMTHHVLTMNSDSVCSVAAAVVIEMAKNSSSHTERPLVIHSICRSPVPQECQQMVAFGGIRPK